MKPIITGKSTELWGQFFNFKSPQIRTFHLTWLAFFLCFFGWFGLAPMMPVITKELSLTDKQVAFILTASVSMTVLGRIIIGWVCDRIGPRITYSALLVFGALPVGLVGLSSSYEALLVSRLAIGLIGASFVVTQYHTSVMFAPNIVGTANATSAGWGNLGAGTANLLVPIVFAALIAKPLGVSEFMSWKLTMIIPAVGMFIMGFIYYFFTQDYPEGNLKDLKKLKDPLKESLDKDRQKASFWSAVKDYRVCALFLIYGACFGLELTINGFAVVYFTGSFQLDLTTAGFLAFLFGSMNLFARTLGGVYGDRFGIKWGLKGRVAFLGAVLLLEGISLIVFSQMNAIVLVVSSMMVFSIFVKMAQGATYSIVPFINKKAMGTVAGIVGAGGNMGAVVAGLIFAYYTKSEYSTVFMILGIAVAVISGLALTVRFSEKAEKEAHANIQLGLAKVQAEA